MIVIYYETPFLFVGVIVVKLHNELRELHKHPPASSGPRSIMLPLNRVTIPQLDTISVGVIAKVFYNLFFYKILLDSYQ